jgi:hypothetical protein
MVQEDLAKVWMSYRDHDGSLLNTRIHWAKESPRRVIIGEILIALVSYWFTQKYHTYSSIQWAKESPRRIIIGKIFSVLVSYGFTYSSIHWAKESPRRVIIGEILTALVSYWFIQKDHTNTSI